MIKTHAGRLLWKKYYTSHFIVRVRKGYSRFYGERELETEHNCNIFTPYSYGRQRCVFLVLQMLNRRPWGPLCWVLAFFTASYQHLLWTPIQSELPRAPSAGCGFPYHISSISDSNSTATANCHSNSTELYNSSMPTRSPTRSLKSHV